MPTTPQKSKAFYYDIDLKNNQIVNAKLHPLTTAERTTLGQTLTSLDKGMTVYDTQIKTLFTWDGGAWSYISLSPTQVQEIEDAYNKIIRSLTVTGNTTSKTITLTAQDNSTVVGSFNDSYVHVQTNPATQWTVDHGLNKYPAVHIVDYNNNEVIGDVRYTTVNQVLLSFSEPFSGSAFFS
jgi:hypothetical protein